MIQKNINEIRELRSTIDSSLIKPPELLRQQMRRQRLQMIQKNINEIRELRSTIDSSLIKPPELLRQQMRRQSTTSIRENFEHDDEKSVKCIGGIFILKDYFNYRFQGVTPKLNAIKKKSPFRMMVESGSDLESIDFNGSSVKDDDMSGSSGSSTTGKSTIKSAGEHKKKTDQLTTHNKFPTAVQGKQEQNVERLPTSPESESKGPCTSFSVQQGHRRQMIDRESDHQSSSIRHEPSYSTEPTRMKSAITTKNKSNIIRNEEILCGSNSSRSAKQNRHYKELLERGTQTEMTQSEQHPEFCSTNVHHVLNEVLRTHLQLLREFNRLEWTSLQEWNSTLDEIRKNYDGPSSKKLQVIIDKYRKKYEQSQL
ncbi:hypothetical protein DICVIV_01767 [Dictyocaulus viviparus]|uniref:Uncharacterized protein n=1 Tax=Dictyocaulus viviparus TaxID=29172 RepID=A0A0D8Y5P5_DICVI|nr:hypothetical protein DICVIV_01767 [Dictyocaulus viviparus]